MDIINKKRDQKAREKKNFSKEKAGVVRETNTEKTVDFFKTGDDAKKYKKHVGDKRTSKKFVGVKDANDKAKKSASPYVHKSGKPTNK